MPAPERADRGPSESELIKKQHLKTNPELRIRTCIEGCFLGDLDISMFEKKCPYFMFI